MNAVSKQGMELRYADSELKKDWQIVMAAVSNMGRALIYAHPDLRKEYPIVKVAVSNCDQLGADRQFVMDAVSWCPDAFCHAHDDLRADPQVVIAAVSKGGTNLIHAHPALRSDLNIVTIAVSDDGNALRFASPELRANVDLIVKAMRDAKHHLTLRSVRDLVDKLMSGALMESDINARTSARRCPIFAPMSRPPFESWRHFERKLLESFWKEKPEGTHVLSNPVCEYLAAEDLMRTTNVCRRSFWANCLGKR